MCFVKEVELNFFLKKKKKSLLKSLLKLFIEEIKTSSMSVDWK